MRQNADILMGIRNRKAGAHGTVQIGFFSKELLDNHRKVQACVKPWDVLWDRKEPPKGKADYYRTNTLNVSIHL